MMFVVFAVAVALLLACVELQVNAEVVTGSVSTSPGSFSFLGKFCFSSDASPDPVGRINMHLSIAPSSVGLANHNNTLQFALFDDQPESWPTVYQSSLSCDEKQAVAKTLPNSSFLIQFDDAGNYYFPTGSISIAQHLRPRFWFVAVSNCNPHAAGNIDVDYRLHFTNIEFNAWDTEFGANEQGLNTLYLVYFLVYVFFVAVHIYSVKKLYAKLSYLHPLVKLFSVVLLIEFVSILSSLLHFGVYAHDGIGIPALAKLATVMFIISRLAFIGLLLLLARGWTITTHDVTGKWPIILSIVVFTIVHVIILLYTYVIEDPAETSVPHTEFVLLNLLIGIYLVIAIIFLYFAIKSYMREEHGLKKDLYLKLSFLFGLWFILPPLGNWGVYSLEDWQRTRVVAAIDVTVTTVGYMVMSFLLWHTRADEYFYVATPSMENTDLGYDHLYT